MTNQTALRFDPEYIIDNSIIGSRDKEEKEELPSQK
jgi:hypothetical protein